MLTREADQTVRTLKFLASPGILKSGTNAMAIHGELGIPGILLRGILRRLTVAGIVRSKRGRTGGVHLEEKALTLSILDVLDAAEPKKKRNSGMWDSASGNPGDPVHALFLKAHNKVREVLAETTVAQLVE